MIGEPKEPLEREEARLRGGSKRTAADTYQIVRCENAYSKGS
jgi:hypothetical protein